MKTFEIDTSLITWEYWQANKAKVYEGISFMESELVPFCLANDHYINSDLSTLMGTKAKEAKNWYFGLYKHDYDFTVYCHERGTCTTAFILLKKLDFFRVTTELVCLNLTSEHGDDEYTEARKTLLDNCLKYINEKRFFFDADDLKDIKNEGVIKDDIKGVPAGYKNMMFWNSVSVERDESKVKIKELINTTKEDGRLADGWSLSLFDISCDGYYLNDDC